MLKFLVIFTGLTLGATAVTAEVLNPDQEWKNTKGNNECVASKDSLGFILGCPYGRVDNTESDGIMFFRICNQHRELRPFAMLNHKDHQLTVYDEGGEEYTRKFDGLRYDPADDFKLIDTKRGSCWGKSIDAGV